MNSLDLQNRLKAFAYRIVPLCESLPSKKISRIIGDQLLRSSFSADANYRAACKAQSGRAFKSKLSIAFEEIDEVLFWIEVISDLNLIKKQKLILITKEADELARILASSRITLEKKASDKILNIQSSI